MPFEEKVFFVHETDSFPIKDSKLRVRRPLKKKRVHIQYHLLLKIRQWLSFYPSTQILNQEQTQGYGAVLPTFIL